MILFLLLGSPLMDTAQADSESQMIERGNQHYQQENYSEAIKQYEQIPSEGPAEAALLYNQANCYYKLEDYGRAIELYQNVSTKSKDMQLIGRAKYNLGNCHFQQGMKKRQDNLQEAFDELTLSIKYYREMLDITPNDEDARHNIAVARLIMKDIMDQIKKEMEKQQQQEKEKQLAQKIKELLKRQTETLQKTVQAHKDTGDPALPAEEKKKTADQLAGEQDTLGNDTTTVWDEAQQMLDQIQAQAAAAQAPPGQQTPPGQQAPAGTPPGQQAPAGTPSGPSPDQMAQMQQQIMQTVSSELSEAVEHQADATEHLNNTQIDQATEPQTKALENLKHALDAFPPQQQQQQDSEQQEQQEQQEQNQQQQQEANEQEQQQKEQPQQLEQQKPPDATAQDILDQEKERKQQQKRGIQGKYEAVDKDW